jgi:hypothetical protein
MNSVRMSLVMLSACKTEGRKRAAEGRVFLRSAGGAKTSLSVKGLDQSSLLPAALTPIAVAVLRCCGQGSPTAPRYRECFSWVPLESQPTISVYLDALGSAMLFSFRQRMLVDSGYFLHRQHHERDEDEYLFTSRHIGGPGGWLNGGEGRS